MKAVSTILPDIQSQLDDRDLAIQAVGIKGVRYPVSVRSGANCVQTIATFAMTVALPACAKGTHMSRFIELLEAQSDPLDTAAFRVLVHGMLKRLETDSGMVEMRFPWFARKSAPVSGVQSLLDHDAFWRGSVQPNGAYRLTMGVLVPATSLCPCSKEISRYGAHNQRSHIAIEAVLTDDLDIGDLIDIAERNASCEVFGLLKRPDEKYVTERAYDNPKFVEDLVRDVAATLRTDRRVQSFSVEAENFESIHNHSAFARIEHTCAERPSRKAGRVPSALGEAA